MARWCSDHETDLPIDPALGWLRGHAEHPRKRNRKRRACRGSLLMSAESSGSNKYCNAKDLTNEASVESFFVLRMLKDLGYKDSEILPKKTLDQVRVGGGRKKSLFRPDYMLLGAGKPRWILDAKAPGEHPDDYIEQGAGYAFGTNQKFDDNPVRFFVLTNGFLTRVFRWDQEEPVMSLRFKDFANDSPKYLSFKSLLGAEAARTGWLAAPPTHGGDDHPGHLLTRPDMEEVKRLFAKCHRLIWKGEKVSPQAAFLRFARVLFVKLWEDRQFQENPEFLRAISNGDPVPAESVRFSKRWIEQQESNVDNPIDQILFRNLVEQLETEISQRKRKRIFDEGTQLDISPGTVKKVVAELEHHFLFGIDEDLNGRMFEAFLNATMRGQELGQYFTPRSIVKLMSRLGAPVARRDHIDRVLDACAGTGGFLIEALAMMRSQVWENQSLTNKERERLLQEIANEAIYGIDAGQDPPLVRIARINMYLHGDGGSRIYMADGLRKVPAPAGTATREVREEVNELRKLLIDPNDPLQFDLVLTNPPFSMDYSRQDPDEAEVLQEYELASWQGKTRQSLRSAILFMERYHDLLKPGGRLLSVIDDSILSNPKFAFARDYLRSRFIISGIISLHGDAFRRAGARTKTSILILTKRQDELESQPDVFVYESRYVGLDDGTTKTPPSVAEEARANAINEIDEIVAEYRDFTAGHSSTWAVPADRLVDRLDAKYLRPWSITEITHTWSADVQVATLSELVDHIEDWQSIDPERIYQFLNVQYSGEAAPGEQKLGKEISYDEVGIVKTGDIVVSNLGSVYGATCILPAEYSQMVVTNEFTVMRLRPNAPVDPYYLWSVLRSPAVRAEWLSGATGLARHRIRWEDLAKQKVPLLPLDKQEAIGDLHREANRLRAEVEALRDKAKAGLVGLNLDAEAALERMIRAKPPQ